ncbi:MAG: hypothetical protein ABIH38_02915 [Patescibacteria group bacterium]
MSDQEKCPVCGCPMRMRLVTDSVEGKKAVIDCPYCHPAAFGLPVEIKKSRLADLPV